MIESPTAVQQKGVDDVDVIVDGLVAVLPCGGGGSGFNDATPNGMLHKEKSESGGMGIQEEDDVSAMMERIKMKMT